MSKAVYAIVTTGVSISNKPRLMDVTREDMKRLSAETNLISGWIQEGHLYDSSEIMLLHSDTESGRKSVDEIQFYLNKVYPNLILKTVEIESLDMGSLRQGLEGMYRFIQQLTDLLTKYPAAHTVFGPIGGYKSMTALSYSLAVSYGHSIWYLHETMDRPITLPTLPMVFDQSVLAVNEVREAIQEMAFRMGYDWSNCIHEEELSMNTKLVVNQHPLLFYRMDELVAISPLARTHLENCPELWHLQIYIRQKKLLKHCVPLQVLRDEFESFYQTERNSKWIKRFQHERQLQKTKNKSWPYSLYRMDNKQYSFRALYQLSDEGELYLYHVWEKHQDYEREINKFDFSKDVASFDANEYVLASLED